MTALLRFLPLLLLLPPHPLASQTPLPARDTRKLQELVEYNPVFAGGHTGFALYDVASRTYLYGYNADRLFVPASNVKLVTFYAAHRSLGGRAPAVIYQRFQDHLEVWGTGYPLALHPQFEQYDELTPWLVAAGVPVTLQFPTGEQAVPRYGAGWSWDDYNYGSVYERSALPLYGNRLFLDLAPPDSTGRRTLMGSPPIIAGSLRQDPDQRRRLIRSEAGNDFSVGPDFFRSRSFPIQRALRLSPQLLANELRASFPQMMVTPGDRPYPARGTAQVLEASLPDTLYRRFLRQSDNFLAEQLVLMSATARYGSPNEETFLDYVQDTLLPTLGVERTRVADGSGLSRYSLLSPRHFTRIVMALDQEVGRDRLLDLLPTGGVNGTLRRRFDGAAEPYVWAKTGSLSGVSCLSGLVRTRSGRWLAFSFLHNNFTGSRGAYAREMERTLGWVYENL